MPKYYAVAKGRSTGVYNDWSSCKANVNGYSGATYKSFNTQAAANAYIAEKSGSSGGSSYSGGSSSGSYGSSRSSGGSSGGSSSNYSSSSYSGSSSSFGGGYSGAKSSNSNVQKIYVDGASRGNGRTLVPDSGYGVYYGANDSRNAAVPLSSVDNVSKTTPTNQRAELHAMKHALTNVANDLKSGNATRSEIHSDSKYTINIYDSWSLNWEKNNWKTSTGQDVANQDIIKSTKPVYDYVNSEYAKRGWGKINLEHVKGHSGDHGNENADRLANLGADEMSRR